MLSPAMNDVAGVLLDVFLMYLCARVAAEVFERLKLPVVVGELLVGVAIGPHALRLIGVPTGPMIEVFGSRAAASKAPLMALYAETARPDTVGIMILMRSFSDILTRVPGSNISRSIRGMSLNNLMNTSSVSRLRAACRSALMRKIITNR